jgi:Protein of unknown function (DUF2752)
MTQTLIATQPTAQAVRCAMLSPVVVPMRRFAVLGAAAVALSAVKLPGRPHTVCPLRALTGIPCPFCGGTTAAVDVGRGDLGGALVASPLAVLGALLLVLAATPWGRRAVRSWRAQPSTSRLLLGGAVLVLSECWQLTRFGLL